jgi:hypothetical protein
MPTIKERVGSYFFLWWFGEIRIESRECGAPNRAAVLCVLLSRGWNGGSQDLLLFCNRKEECCSMRIPLDKKPSDGVAIAFVVITLLIPVTLAILLSRLHAVF